MITFRISKCAYINDLSDAGARTYGGRWNNKGVNVVYTAESVSLATLEALVHLTVNTMPKDFCIAEIEIPQGVSVYELIVSELPQGWNNFPAKFDLKMIGDSWIAENKYAVLKVPSAITHREHNYLINPSHPKSKLIKIASSERFYFDPRLL